MSKVDACGVPDNATPTFHFIVITLLICGETLSKQVIYYIPIFYIKALQ